MELFCLNLFYLIATGLLDPPAMHQRPKNAHLMQEWEQKTSNLLSEKRNERNYKSVSWNSLLHLLMFTNFQGQKNSEKLACFLSHPSPEAFNEIK